MNPYPLKKIFGAIEYVQEMRKSNYLHSNLVLNKQIRNYLFEEFNKFYVYNYKILKNQNFYINLLKESYKILLEIINLEINKTLKNYTLMNNKLKEFEEKIQIVYGCFVFKKA